MVQSVIPIPTSKKIPRLPLKKTTTTTKPKTTKRQILFYPLSLVSLIFQCMLLIGMAHAQKNNSVVVSINDTDFNLTFPNSNGTPPTKSYILSELPPPIEPIEPIETRVHSAYNSPTYPPPPRHPSPPPPPPSPSPPTGSLPLPLNELNKILSNLSISDLQNIKDSIDQFTIYLESIPNNGTDYLKDLFKSDSNSTIISSKDIEIIREIFNINFLNTSITLKDGFSLSNENYELGRLSGIIEELINAKQKDALDQTYTQAYIHEEKKDSIIIGSVIAFIFRLLYVLYQEPFNNLLNTESSSVKITVGLITIIILPEVLLKLLKQFKERFVQIHPQTQEVGSAVGGKKQDYTKTTEKYGSRCVYLSKRKGKYLKVDGKFMPYKSAVKMLDKKKKTSKSNK